MHGWERKMVRIGALLLIIGAVLSVGALAVNGFSLDGLEGVSYQEITYTPEGEFDRLDVSAVDAEIHIQLAQDGACRVVCDETERWHYAVEVQDGALAVRSDANWGTGIHINVKSPQLTIELPEKAYAELKLHSVSGDVDVTGLRIGALAIDTTSGEVELESADAANFSITSVSGDVKGSLRSGKTFDVRTVSGDVKLPQSTSGGAFRANTTSGDVEISLK